jgi:HEAT repeat protein
LDVPGTTAALARLLPKTDPQTQLALIGALVQRHDAPATRDVVALATSPDPALRLAVINALGTLGDAYAAPFLAEQAAAGAPEIQRAARESLLELRHGRPTATLLGLLETAPPATQVEAAHALGQRGDQNAAAPLMELAAHHTGPTRKSALLALAFLATEQQLPALLQFVLDARDDTNRVEAAESVRSAYERLQTRQGHVDAEPLRLAMASASAEARIALLPVCSGLVNPQARMALRSALSDPDEDVRARALRALCDAVDRDYIPDLLTVVHDAKDQKTRTLAVTACVRLNSAEEPTKLPVASRIQTYKALLAEPLIPEQKRLVLAGLAEVPDIRALNLTEPLVEDNDTKAEAAQTAIKIATALSAENSQEALAVLRKALGAAANDASRQALEAAIARVEATSDYITNWQLAGPFRQEGKKFNELFDVPFPPEIPEEPGAATPAPGVKWQIVPAAAKAKAPYIIDLMPVFGGEQAVGYARTWIKSDAQQPVRMELGTDDGVKVWLNGKVVHSHNVARPLKPAEDIVELDLKSGWNLLLLKITQNNLGWEFCARLRKPDGSHIDNVSYESSH